VAWIEPLALETWMINVFAGTPDIFTVISLLVIAAMAGYFRMTMIGMFFMLGTFLIMFSTFLNSPILVAITVIGGLLIGYNLSKIFAQ